MSSRQSWILGSDPSCDIVVEEPTVSGRHCRVQSTPDGYTVEDLESTNGVFVNGRQRTSVVRISPKDQVTLGQAVPFPWERLRQLATTRVIRIGRAPDNDVVLDHANVSAHHARIAIDPSEMTIEDLGSTNGTALNTAENTIQRARLRKEDTLFLGSTSIPVAKLLDGVLSTDIQSEPAEPSRSRKPTLVLFAVGAVLLVFLLPLGLRVLSDGDAPQQSTGARDRGQSPVDGQQSSAGTLPTHSGEVDIRPDGLNLPSGEVPQAKQESSTAPTAESTPEDALFWVVVANAAGDQAFRVGSAFAVDSRHLVTTAVVIQLMLDEQRDQHPQAWVFSPTRNIKREITASRIHGEFKTAFATGRDAQRQHDAMREKLSSQSLKPQDLDKAKKVLIESWQTAFEAAERLAYFDVGVLEVDPPLETYLPLAPPDVSLRPKLKVRVFGPGFDREDPFLDPQAGLVLPDLNTRVNKLVRYDSSQTNVQRLLVDCDRKQLELCLAGCPIVNAQGRVIAMYGRPTPPTDMSQETFTTDTFDAVLVDRVREMLPPRP
jgi:pSer/pThr/pTyr-binding forkhead associated (FHA) protein